MVKSKSGVFATFDWLLCIEPQISGPSSSSSSSDFWLTCRYSGHIHNSGPPSRQLACCMHGRSHTRSPGVSIMRVDSWELPLSAIPLCQLFQVNLGLAGPCFPLTCMSEAVLTAPLERSTCPYQRSLLSFSMRSRSSMPSRASSSVDLMVAVFCGLTLQICLIIALSFRCRRWRQGFVTGQVSLAWSIALRIGILKKKNCYLLTQGNSRNSSLQHIHLWLFNSHKWICWSDEFLELYINSFKVSSQSLTVLKIGWIPWMNLYFMMIYMVNIKVFANFEKKKKKLCHRFSNFIFIYKWILICLASMVPWLPLCLIMLWLRSRSFAVLRKTLSSLWQLRI